MPYSEVSVQSDLQMCISVKDFGAIMDGTYHPISEWIADGRYADLAAIQVDYPFVIAVTDGIDWAAFKKGLRSSQFGSLFLPTGVLYLDRAVEETALNNVCLFGTGRTQASIVAHGSFTAMTFTDCGFWDVSGVTVSHAVGATSGRGLVFDGTSGANQVREALFQANPDGGLAFLGTEEAQQSENEVLNVLFLDNGGDQCHFRYSNDFRIAGCRAGRFSNLGYAATGFRLENSGAGSYDSTYHWNNVRGLHATNCHFVRVAASNRFEESRQEGALFENCNYILIVGNQAHTNSQENPDSVLGVYSAIRFSGCAYPTAVGNMTFSWASDTYKHKHGLEFDQYCTNVSVVGNQCDHNVGAPIDTSAAYPVTRSGNSGDTVSVMAHTAGAATLEVAVDLDNPNGSDWATLAVVYKVAGSNRAAMIAQRAGNTPAGFFSIQTADISGDLQTRFTIDSEGRIQIVGGLPTSPTGLATGMLWSDGGTVKIA